MADTDGETQAAKKARNARRETTRDLDDAPLEETNARPAGYERVGERALAACRGYGKLILFGEHFVVDKEVPGAL